MPGAVAELSVAGQGGSQASPLHRTDLLLSLQGGRTPQSDAAPDRVNKLYMVSIIVAVAENGVIGDKNTLLWHISEDLKHFKAVTTGHPVIMGRKTYESLGRPAPEPYQCGHYAAAAEIAGCTVAHSLGEALALFSGDDEVFVIGGAQIYAQALPLADPLLPDARVPRLRRRHAFPRVGRSAVAASVVRILRIGCELPLSFRVRDLRAPAKLGIYTTARLARIPYLCTAKVFLLHPGRFRAR